MLARRVLLVIAVGVSAVAVEAQAERPAMSVRPEVEYLVERFGLTADEASAQLELGDEAQDFIQENYDVLAPTWAGGWVDNRSPGKLFIAHTAGAPVDLLREKFGSQLELLEVDYTAEELEQAADAVAAQIGADSSTEIAEVAVDIQGNRVALRVDEASAATVVEALSASRRATAVPIVILDEEFVPSEPEACDSRDDCDPPLRGGINVSSCTSGFMFRNTSTNRRYASSAGHCNPSYWHHNGTVIGFLTDQVFDRDQGSVNAVIINIRDRNFWTPKPWVYAATNKALVVTKKIAHPRAGLEGLVLCVHGRKGDVCGELLDYSVTSGRTRQGKIDADACPGDSGAAVGRRLSVSVAYGIHRGGPTTCHDPDGHSVFTWTAYVEQASADDSDPYNYVVAGP